MSFAHKIEGKSGTDGIILHKVTNLQSCKIGCLILSNPVTYDQQRKKSEKLKHPLMVHLTSQYTQIYQYYLLYTVSKLLSV